jgi:Peptidase family M23
MTSLPRPRRAGVCALVLACGFLAPPVTLAAPLPPIAHGSFTPPGADDPTIPLPTATQQARAAEAFRLQGTALYPLYAWPMQRVLGDGLFCANYVDEDSTAGFYDFMGGDWTYDTHRGTDISLYDFKSMDRGFRIVAAAPGVVTTAVYANLRDRNCDVPDNPTLNYIEVANGDGTYTYYYHLRSNSMTVNLGESVQTGQVLGLAGSSGYSFGPHMHFEAADWLNGPYTPRDPWAGPDNPKPGLWISQPPYAGTQAFTVLDMGTMTNAAAGVDLGTTYPDYCATIMERVQEPATWSLTEPILAVWLYAVGHIGQSYTVEIDRPDGSVYATGGTTLTADFRGPYQYWAWYFSPYASPAGVWKARVLSGSVELMSHSFVVGAATVYPPRFMKSGRSFRLDGVTTQRDTLHLKPLGATGTTLALLGAPGFVSLHDSTVTVGPVSTQTNRSLYFQVVATNTAGLRDTAWYHVVDPGKPLDPITGVGPAGPVATALRLEAWPEPFSASTWIRWSAPRPGPVRLEVFDALGRRVRRLVDRDHEPALTGGVTWDGRDASGHPAPAGIYLCRLAAGGESTVLRLIRLP